MRSYKAKNDQLYQRPWERKTLFHALHNDSRFVVLKVIVRLETSFEQRIAFNCIYNYPSEAG